MRELIVSIGAVIGLSFQGCEPQESVPFEPRPTPGVDAPESTPSGTVPDSGSAVDHPSSAPGEQATSDEARAATELARTALNAWRGRDIATLAGLSAGGAAEIAPLLDPSTARYRSLFGPDSWRYAAVAEWNGDLGPVRRASDTMLVEFGVLPDRTVGCVELVRDANRLVLSNLIKLRPDEAADLPAIR